MDETEHLEPILFWTSLEGDAPLDGFCHAIPAASVPTALEGEAVNEIEASNGIDPASSANAHGKEEPRYCLNLLASEETVSAKVGEAMCVKGAEPKGESRTPDETRDASIVSVPNQDDILCGQSRVCANHPGNRRFQGVLSTYAKVYTTSATKVEKMSLTKEIVTRLKESGSRFLKHQDGVWTEISDVAARDKVGHALRTKVASWNRKTSKTETK